MDCHVRSDYFRSLDPDVFARYSEKISIIDGMDPYSIRNSEWVKNPDPIPNLTYPDLVNYLVFQKSRYTLKEFKAYKSLDAFNQFACGWVSDVNFVRINGFHLVKAKVNHSQRLNEKPLEPWVIVEKDGIVNCAHCTCQAGLGEACTHVGAILFYLEFAARHQEVKTVTEVSAYWTVPGSNNASFARLKEIDFSTPKQKCRILEGENVEKVSSALPKKNVPKQTEEQFHEMLKKLSDSDANSGILSIIPPFSENFIPKPTTDDKTFNLKLLYDETYSTLTLQELIEIGSKISTGISISDVNAAEVERKTKQQSKSKMWFTYRAGRVTASQFKPACHTRSTTSAPSLIKSICYPEKARFKSKATEWGCCHEKVALKKYAAHMSPLHKGFAVRNSGLFINPAYPQFGATPDTLVTCDCCGAGCVEIKCPYCLKDTSIEENGDKISCLELKGDVYQLKRDHQYYYQTQAQIFICEVKYCDFVIWANKGEPHMERICPNTEFWEKWSAKANIFLKSLYCQSFWENFSLEYPQTC